MLEPLQIQLAVRMTSSKYFQLEPKLRFKLTLKVFATPQQGCGSLEAEPPGSLPCAPSSRAKWSLASNFKLSACVKHVETSVL